MDNWRKFDKTTIPPKEAFYRKLNLEGISDADYAHVQKVWKVPGIKIVANIMTCMHYYCL